MSLPVSVCLNFSLTHCLLFASSVSFSLSFSLSSPTLILLPPLSLPQGYDGEEKAYVVTQGPLANTVADLWALVMQERSPAVVMITRLKEKRRVKCEPYVPALSATYGDITVTVKQLIHKNGYTTRQLLLQVGLRLSVPWPVALFWKFLLGYQHWLFKMPFQAVGNSS